MREPSASYICSFDAKSSALSNYWGLILDESSTKSGGWLGPTPKAAEGLYRVREPRASYTCDFNTKNSRLSNYRPLILDES